MKKTTMLCVFILVVKLSYSQKKDPDKWMEYVQRDSVEILVSVFIPSFTGSNEYSSPVVIERKGALLLELHFIKQEQSKDTCYIVAYDKVEWIGIDPKYGENACVNDDEHCYIIITGLGNYTIRFRKGTKTLSYQLIIKD